VAGDLGVDFHRALSFGGPGVRLLVVRHALW
jgi:hypothetical protein